MTEDNDFEFNYCPWCDEPWESVKASHYLGYPNPKSFDELSPQAKRQYRFYEAIYGNDIDEKYPNSRHIIICRSCGAPV